MTHFTSKYVTDLLNDALDQGIGIEATRLVSPFTPSVAYPSLNKIIINMGWHDQEQLPYTIAHEIGHVVHNDPAGSYFTPAKNAIEGEANKYAVDKLVSMYCPYVEEEQANMTRLMDAFHIPNYLEGYVHQSMNHFYEG